MITHYSVSVDDLEWDRYYYGELIAQGRLSATIFHRFFKLTDNYIYIQDFWGMVFLCIGAILLCIILNRIVKKESCVANIIFSCLFVSYPLYSELFSYVGTFLAIGVGLILVALSLLCVMSYQSEKRIKYLLLAVLFILPAVSWYEAVLIIYIVAVFGILLLMQLEEKDNLLNIKQVMFQGIIYTIPLAIAVGIEAVVLKLIMTALKIEPSTLAANEIVWLKDDITFSYFRECYLYFFEVLIKSVINYFPVTIFFIASLITFCVVIFYTFKLKKFGIFICGVGLFVSNFIISILTLVIWYRTCISFAFFVAFSAFLIISRSNSLKEKRSVLFYKISSILCCILIFAQVNSINYYFTTDYLRFEYEKNVLTNVRDELCGGYDLEKNIVFTGEIEMPQNIKNRSQRDYKNIIYRIVRHTPFVDDYVKNYFIPDPYLKEDIQQTNSNSYINWAELSFDSTQESMEKFFEFLGFDGIKTGTKEQILAAAKIAEEMPSWPEKGSIKDVGEYIVVNF